MFRVLTQVSITNFHEVIINDVSMSELLCYFGAPQTRIPIYKLRRPILQADHAVTSWPSCLHTDWVSRNTNSTNYVCVYRYYQSY